MKRRKTARKTKHTPEYDSRRETRVLLEEMNKGIKTIAEQHGGVVKRLDKMDENIRKNDSVRFKLEWGIESLHSRVGTLDTKSDRIENELKAIKTAVMEVNKDVKKNANASEEMKEKLDTVIADHENRLKKLEVV